ncbi:MAG TPA: sugar phosphate nucleotidyltransferase [Steroidobacteraceae bacterium]|nr:sugar phosphate nucleotidyltransferase [Steroidobacteraceae bacterium]
MRQMANAWAVVMAGGDGARLRALTRTREGLIVPKQYCSLGRSECLLQDAVMRAQKVVNVAHVSCVVAAQHRRWWSTALSNISDTNIVVQPQNKGTGYGILLALLKLERINPAAIVTLLPADHYFTDDAPIIRTLRLAANLASDNPRTIYLLGTEPAGPDSELGYILPAGGMRRNAAGVAGFTEKPEFSYACELLRLGALWNLFILVGGVGALLKLFESSHSRQAAEMSTALDRQSEGQPNALDVLYETIAPIDFSRDVLELEASRLQVLGVPRCGWTDLGTPQRVEATVRHLSANAGISGARAMTSAPPPLFFDLSTAPV